MDAKQVVVIEVAEPSSLLTRGMVGALEYGAIALMAMTMLLGMLLLG